MPRLETPRDTKHLRGCDVMGCPALRVLLGGSPTRTERKSSARALRISTPDLDAQARGIGRLHAVSELASQAAPLICPRVVPGQPHLF